MAKHTFRKLDIADEYLSVAAELYFQGYYFPALGLASMAEEIFEAVMEARNEAHAIAPIAPIGLRLTRDKYRPISKDLIILAKAVNKNLRGLKDAAVRRLLYRAKNSAKHGTLPHGKKGFDLTIDADAELEAYTMLSRATKNYIRLHYEPRGALRKFYEKYITGRTTSHHEGASM